MENDQYKLYASDYTRKGLGSHIAARLPEIAELDVVVISREDIVAYKHPVSDEDIANKTPAYLDAIDYQATAENLQSLLDGAGVGVSQNVSASEASDPLIDKIINHEACALKVDADKDGAKDFGIIVAPDFNMDNRDWVAGLSHQSKDRIENVPEGRTEGLAAVMYHEAGHIHDAQHHDHTVFGEMYADDRAKTFYFKDVEAGILDGDFWPAFEAARAGGGLMAMGGYMDTVKHRIDVASVFGLPVTQVLEQPYDAKTIILPLHSTAAVFNDSSLAQQSLDEVQSPEFRGMFIVHDMVKAIAMGINMQEMEEENAGRETLTDEAAKWSQDFFENPMQSYSQDMASAVYEMRQHPDGLYAVVRAMEDKGIFSGDAFRGERDYIDSLDEFYQTYMPEATQSEDYHSYYEKTSQLIEQQDLVAKVQGQPMENQLTQNINPSYDPSA